jgi:outer membrane murein-binding lipoprotein Lpp
MKKILLGLLIVGALSACSSSQEKEVSLPTQVQTLNETVSTQTQKFEALKTETEELEMQIQELNDLINEFKN